MKYQAAFILSVLLTCGLCHAQEISDVYITSDTLQVYFRQDKTTLDDQFRDNGNRLVDFSLKFHRLLIDPHSKVRSIVIVSGASPEGNSTRNRYLSDNRAKVVYDYLTANHLIDSSHIEIESRGVDWKGLEARVRASDLPYKDEVLEILALPEWIKENGQVTDGRKHRLMNYRGGKVWNELYDLYFADLRGTRVMIVYNILKIDRSLRIPEPATDSPGLIYPAQDAAPQPKKRPFYLSVQTNLLSDMLSIPSIGAEIGIGKGFTLGGNYQNIWLRNDSRTRWYRFEGFETGINWYINKEKRPFKGHHIGLYGHLVTWDFTINGRGYLAERWAYGGGLAYGYVLPIGRRFTVDIEIGFGYLEGKMHEYIPLDGHRVWQSYEPFQWIGPTKAGITLQWLVCRGNHDKKGVKGR